MPQPNYNQENGAHIRQTQIKSFLREEEVSLLGRKLNKVAREIEDSDEPAFNEAAVEKEMGIRRGR